MKARATVRRKDADREAKAPMRWTLLFSTSGASNYLSQLRRMDAILGVQYLRSIHPSDHGFEQRAARLGRR